MLRPPPLPTLFPYTTLFRSLAGKIAVPGRQRARLPRPPEHAQPIQRDAAQPAAKRAAARFILKVRQLANEHGHHRSEEHTSELQSLTNLVCRLLLEKKKKK